MPIKLNTASGGGVTLSAANTATDKTITVPAVDTTMVGTDATQTLTNKTIQGGAITSGTAVASTSGTAIDFTGIPSWVKRITVMFNGVSLSGTDVIIVRLGTSGGPVTSGYNTTVSIIASTNNTTRLSKTTTAFYTNWAGAAAYLTYGAIVFTNVSSNTWAGTGLFYQDQGATDAHSVQVAGAIALGGTLDRVRVTTVNGTDTFDAGSINILYEG